MNFWLVKADPDTDYSIDDLKSDGETIWDGVHSNPAILNIQKMNIGDKVYIYHSQKQKSIVGLAKVISEPFLNFDDPRRSWAMRIKFVKKYDNPLHLSVIKESPECQDFALVKISRLSVMPVDKKVNKYLESILT